MRYLAKGCGSCMPMRSLGGARGMPRPGLTLIEMMISVVLTLMIVFAVVQAFQMMGTGITNGRAAIEMSGEMRAPVARLQKELDHVSCPVRPPLDPDAAQGYFFYLEGPNSDRNYNRVTESATSIDAMSRNGIEPTHFGDLDDILSFTATRTDSPFSGTLVAAGGATTIESTTAEVVWWIAQVFDTNVSGNVNPPPPPRFVLLRRTFLVRPDLALPANFAALGSDLSVRQIGGTYLANNLGHVTDPRNRALATFANTTPPAFPTRLYVTSNTANDPLLLRNYERFVVLNDVLAFDVRAFDPLAPIVAGPSYALVPGDPGYPLYGPANDPNSIYGAMRLFLQGNGNSRIIGRGAFVDLGYLVERPVPTGTRQVPNTGGPPPPPNLNLPVIYTNISGDTWKYGVWTHPQDSQRPARISHFSGLPTFRDLQGKVGGSRDQLGANDRFWLATARNSNVGIGVAVKQPSGTEFLNLFRYDTWTTGFESDGVDQDDRTGDFSTNSASVDEGTNGIDDDNKAGIDDSEELETMAPYPVGLRGIEVRIRKMEPSTRQIRQISIVSDFVPE